MGPEPVVALAEAILKDDEKRVDQIWQDIRSIPPVTSPEDFATGFPHYNAQMNKYLTNAAGFVKGGPCRAPYRISDLPESWKAGADLRAKAWNELRKRYLRAPGL